MMEPVADEVLKKACEAFSEAYAIYPDGSGKTPITDWFEIDAQDAVDFGVLKVARWSYHSDIRSDEYRAYVATVIREPMRAALSVCLSDAEARIAELQTKIEWLELEAEGHDNGKRDLAGLLNCADEPRWKHMRHEVVKLKARAEAAEALLKEAGPIIINLMETPCVRNDPHNDGLYRAARAIHDKIGVKDE